MTTTAVLQSMIPVSRFNKGEAGRIFDELTHDKTKIVVKNNVPVAVILSPDEYARIIDENADNILLAEASMRVSQSSQSDFISETDFMRAIGVTQEEIDTSNDVEIE
ncbi:type II toxin-antitoxin system Phd/YefM family antitoxin [Treponema zuelzerae]|uniref:Type II toxin-antitoxin system Phd/YefM family antitoxin n=1 Tax=Teretinema zuelzerae TaxID=156 RepID=A0AAE3JII8_9SPIR|nr:type II toxin-antitoxin system Phd/YefM family antitoxin [Teretinema zuelzerae]MCD1653185.1 type II toxin-antitoxin system Phd/YefM family antitoxin [Teretinema zuelzerae]